MKDFKASDMASLSFKNDHRLAEDKAEQKDLRKNDRSGGSEPQLVQGRGLDLAISEINLEVFKIRCGAGRGGRTPSMKADPTEMVTIMQMTVGFTVPSQFSFCCLYSSHLILTIWFYSKHAYGSILSMARAF